MRSLRPRASDLSTPLPVADLLITDLLIGLLLIGMLLPGLSGCAAPAQVISTDLTRQSGVYIIGYVDREDIRAKLEDRFVADLSEEGIRAVASRHDIRLIKKASTAEMVRAANSQSVAAVLIINRIEADGSGSIIRSDQRIAPDDPDLQRYLDATSKEPDAYANDEPVYAEANAFLIDGNRTRRFWTGTTWTFQGDDDEVIGNISQTIAKELGKVSREMRNYSRPIR